MLCAGRTMPAARRLSTSASPGALERRGRAGRSSVSGVRAVVFGSTGFLARYVVNELGRVGSQVVVPFRGEETEIRHLRLMGDLGQVLPVRYWPTELDTIREAVQHANVVINLMGSDFETGNFSFGDVHHEIPAAIAGICSEMGVQRMVHVSALGADGASPSPFMRSKFTGEAAVRAAFPGATIVRPAPLIGHEDRYLRLMAWLQGAGTLQGAGFMGHIPLVDGGQNKQQPVAAADVGVAIAKMLEDSGTEGKTFELAGPDAYTMEELAAVVFHQLDLHEVKTVDVPLKVAQLMAKPFGRRMALINTKPRLTEDTFQRMALDCLPAPNSLGFADLGMEPRGLDTSQLDYMRQFRKTGERGVGGFLNT